MNPEKQIGLQLRELIESSNTNLTWSDGITKAFISFGKSLLRWNKKIRLTGAASLHDLSDRHFVDSLIALSTIAELPEDSTVLDVGSGAGFPAIPLAILRPDLHWLLVESHHKRAAFLQQARRDLKIPKMKIRPVRFNGEPEKEKLPTDCACVTFRAVNPEQVLPIIHHYLSPEGQVLYWGTEHTPPTCPETLTLTDTTHYTLSQGESFCLYTFNVV